MSPTTTVPTSHIVKITIPPYAMRIVDRAKNPQYEWHVLTIETITSTARTTTTRKFPVRRAPYVTPVATPVTPVPTPTATATP
jgi:hypothetical protein